MNRFPAIKVPLIIVLAALVWTFIADPLIRYLAKELDPHHQDLYRRINDLIVILVISFVLYARIRKQQEHTLKAADEYRQLFEEIPAPMFIFSSQTFRILAVNAAAVQQYGYSHEEFLGLKMHDIRPPEEIPAFLATVINIPNNYFDAGRWRHRRKNGETFYVHIYSHHTEFDGVPAKQTLAINIDQKVRTEKALQEKSAELENMLGSITDGFYALNRNWEVTYINKTAERVLSCKKEDILGKNLWDYFPGSREGHFYAEYLRAVNEKVSVHFEELYAPLGVWGAMNVYPTVDGIAVFFVDITQQKKTQEKIYNDEQNLRAIINNTRDLIWSVDKDFNILTGNQPFWGRVERMTGKTAENIKNTDFEQELTERYLTHYDRAFLGETFSIIQQSALKGRPRYEQLSFNPIRDHDHVIGVNCFLRDITDEQQHLERIEQQNKQLKEIAWIQSHKVRSSVANILGLTQLCSLGIDTAEIVPRLQLAASQLDQIIREINGLTDNLETGAGNAGRPASWLDHSL
jgi:PAS domain S-box-containing protein